MKKPLLILFLFFAFSSFSQQVERPMRFDFKFGNPGLFGINAEYVSPFLGNKLAFYASYHGFNSNYHHKDIDERVRYFDGGINYFFKNTGNGLYASAGYGHMYIDAGLSEVVIDEGNIIAEAYGEFKANTLNLKLGFKTKGLIFVRAEVGYGFGNIPKTVYVEGSLNNQIESTFIERPYYPGMSDTGYVLATIGAGIAF